MLVFQPGQTDGEVSDTAPAQGSVCYALGVAPGQDVDVTLTYGGQARFSIAGLVQDQRRYEFTAERSLYEIRVHQQSGATDVEPFVLAIHAEPLPIPEPPAAPPQSTPERTELAETATEADETVEAVSDAPDPVPGPDQQLAAQEDTAPEPGPEPAQATDSDAGEPTVSAPDSRTFGPGWTVVAGVEGGVARIAGTATDYVTEFEALCGAALPRGVHMSLSGDPDFVLSRTAGAESPVRVAVTGNDGSAQVFDTTLVYDLGAARWQSGAPLPIAFVEAFAGGAVMTVRSEADRAVATFLLYGTSEARTALGPLCAAGPAVAVASSAPEPVPAGSAQPVSADSGPVAAEAPAPNETVLAAVDPTPVPTGLTQVPPIGERTYGAGWSVTEGDSDIIVVGTATDYLTLFQGYCDLGLPAGVHLTMSGPSLPGLSRSETAATPVRVEVTATDGTVRAFTTALTYRAAQSSWRSGLPLSAGFVDAFTRGAIMKVVTDGGTTIATYILAGVEQAREPMTKICASASAPEQPVTTPPSAASAADTPVQQAGPAEPATPPAPAVPVATTGAEAPDGWVVSTEGGGVSTRGLAVDGVSVLQARCGAGLPPGVQVTLSGDPHGRLQRGGTQPVRIEITDDDQAPEVFNTVLSYQDTGRNWVSQLPLPSSFAYAFGHGVIMKIFTADGVPAATFILFGTAEARDRMRAVCGF